MSHKKSLVIFCMTMIGFIAFDWLNNALDSVYFNQIVLRENAERNESIVQSWIDERVLYGISTPPAVINWLGVIIIFAIVKNIVIFLVMKKRLRNYVTIQYR